jgi:hypothetical protein
MKTKLWYTAALAAAGLALSPGSVRANVPVSSSYGDLILGFEANGSADDLEVNLGSYTQFLDATAPFTVTFGINPNTSATVTNLNSDLGIFGASGAWASNTSLLWGVVGVESTLPSINGYDVFLTQDPALGTTLDDQAATTTRGWATDIKAVDGASGLGAYANDGDSTEAADIGTSAANSWTDYADYGTSGFGTGKIVEQANGDSAIGSLNLYEVAPNGSTSTPATDVGSFTLNSSGGLTFTPAAVPEPSTWVSLIGGTLFLAFFRRRSLASRGQR